MSGSGSDETVLETGAVALATASLVPEARAGGRYRIVRFLAAGGMGEVYEAEDLVLGGPVALKALRADLSGAARAVERLRREVALARKITHPNVCRLHDVGEHEGRIFLTMELLAGETLATRIARGALPPAELDRLARQLVAALAALHAAGVIHRDLKPSNVILDGARAVVTDFGLARSIALEDAGLTAEASFLGTPAYMAPEQIEGRDATAASDIYALGVLLFEAGTGRLPFREDTPMATATARLHKDPPRPGIDRRWDAVILGCLARDPAARFARVEDVLDPPSRRWRRRWIVAAAAVAVAAGTAVVALRRDDRAWRADLQLLPTYDENSDSPRLSPDGTLIAYQSDRERKDWYRIYLMRRDGSDDRPITGPGLNLQGELSWARDGRSILVSDRFTKALLRIPVDGGKPDHITDAVQGEECGDGLMLLRQGLPDCKFCWGLLWRAADGDERELVRSAPGEWLGEPRCDRDGRHLVYARAAWWTIYPPADLWVIDLPGGAPRRLTDDRRRNVTPAFTPSGTIVFSSARGGPNQLWEIGIDGGEPRQLTHGEGNDLAPDVASDGRTLVYQVDVTSRPLFAHALDGVARRIVHSRPDLAMLAPVSDGTEVIATDRSSDPPRIVAVRISDGAVRTIAAGQVAAATPDGAEVVYVTGAAPAQVLARGRDGRGPPRRLGDLDGRVVELRVGPDGFVHVALDRADGMQAWRLPLGGGSGEREAPSPWCFVYPAPAGGWTAWIRCGVAGSAGPSGRRDPRSALLVPPGGTVDPLAPRFQIVAIGEFDAAGEVFVYQDHVRVHRVELATGVKTPLFSLDTDTIDLTVSSDGRTVYTSEIVGRVRRARIDNFADRPPLR